MTDIDPYLKKIEGNQEIQDKLQSLAVDVFNNNEFLTAIHPQENPFFVELMGLVEPIIKQGKDIFLDKRAVSGTGKLNYPHIRSIAESDDEGYFVSNVAQWIIICLASEKQKNNVDYVKQMLDDELNCLPQGVDLEVSKDGLVNLSASSGRMQLRKHAIALSDGRRIYLHQFLRRHFSANFVDIPDVLVDAMGRGFKVEARVDPFRLGDMRRYHEIIECDAWFGLKFSRQLLDSKDLAEKVTVHHFNGDNSSEKRYNQYATVFRTSMLDPAKGFRQFFVEEYMPYTNWLGSPMSNFCGEYAIQRFAHFVYDQNNGNFEHIDCAVRVFDRGGYDRLYEVANRGNDPGGRVGKRVKLFKISGGVDYGLVERCLYAFFRYNIQILEYLHNVSFDVADYMLRSRSM